MRIIAHRGFSSRAPENTMAAFSLALEQGADGLELDVQMSKDGEVIICHDETVNRTTNGEGLVKDYTLAELQKLDAGSWFSSEYEGERIPALKTLFSLVKDKDLLINVELKTGLIQYKEIEEKVVQLVKEYDLVNNTIISSFNHYSLVRIKELLPELKTGILYMAGLYQPWEYAASIKADALHPLFRSVVPEIVQGVKEHGLLLNPFTVDKPEHIKLMIAAGVDGIITNYPERVSQQIG